ncbi:NepR family anti-sigma factor [Pontixanthobacter aquaemixtae]|uniref:Anti-sigma factor NepR domain-containing protein n=1 Tax=Pontixanthobacter aquaemixtae TaxID=1958940 RepID=A0A844ZYK2_9SPHN|nr:NepR family anti-sigma factor [Pontixanthobacter aquaemixtae]MXO91817.1 hypothetical protein [Pontixanthobacter aquaemixtae]
MTADKAPANDKDTAAKAGTKNAKSEPAWANGLREIYDSVVDEPLPDSFADLLAKLDDPS